MSKNRARVEIADTTGVVYVELYGNHASLGVLSTADYNTLEEIPEWMQGAVAVLDIALGPVADVGYKIRGGESFDYTVYWINKPQDDPA